MRDLTALASLRHECLREAAFVKTPEDVGRWVKSAAFARRGEDATVAGVFTTAAEWRLR
jgi:hypothetical protein